MKIKLIKAWVYKYILKIQSPSSMVKGYQYEYDMLKKKQRRIKMILEEPRKMEDVTLKCDECGEEFTPGSRPDGLPNGIGIQMQDGRIYNICSECIIKLTPERIEEIKRKIK